MIPNDHNPRFRRGLCFRSLSHNLNPFPPSMRVTFTATTSGQIAAGSAASSNYYVCGNSPFLPFNTATGFPAPLVANASNTCAGYSLLCALAGPYSAYRCAGSAIRIRFAESSALDGSSVTVAPMTATFASFTAAAKSRYACSKLAMQGDGIATLSNAISTTEVTGDAVSALIYQSGNAALYNAYPASLWFWEFWYATGDAAVLTGNVDYRVDITYDVILENPQFDKALLDAVADVKPELALPLHEAAAELGRLRVISDAKDSLDSAYRAIATAASSSSSTSFTGPLSSSSSSSSSSSVKKR